MSVRETSLLAYQEITENGLLSEMRMRAYRALAEHGPMTGSELDRFLGAGLMDPSYSRRLSELRDVGVVREVRKRCCRVTGNLAIEWDITDELPTRLRKDPVTEAVTRVAKLILSGKVTYEEFVYRLTQKLSSNAPR